MTAPEPPRIFIAYSTKDGAEIAARLRRELEAIGLSVWQDLVALEGGRDWWSQIEAALKSKVLQHFVLIVTAGALASSIVRREIRLARQEGKSFLPIKGPGLGHTAELRVGSGRSQTSHFPSTASTSSGLSKDRVPQSECL